MQSEVARKSAVESGVSSGSDGGSPLWLRMRLARIGRRMTQQQLAKKFGVTQPTIWKWEQGSILVDGKQVGYEIPSDWTETLEGWIATGKAKKRSDVEVTVVAFNPSATAPGVTDPEIALHDRLRKTRILRRISQNKLATMFHVTRQTVRDWEAGPYVDSAGRMGYQIPFGWRPIVERWISKCETPTRAEVRRAKFRIVRPITVKVDTPRAVPKRRFSRKLKRNCTWKELRRAFESQALVGVTERTRDHYGAVFNVFERLASPKRAKDLNARVLCEFIVNDQNAGRGPVTVNNHLRHLKRLISWAHEQKVIREIPKLKLLREPRRLPKKISQAEFDSLLAQAPDDTWRAFFLIAWYTGLRFSELLGLMPEDIDLGRDTIQVRAEIAKNRCDASLPLHPVVTEAIRKLTLKPGTPVLDFGVNPSCVSERVRRISSAAGLQGFGMHTLRRSFCSNLAAAGVSLQIAQRLMRHSDPKLTMTHYTNTEDLLAGAVAKLPPTG